MFNILKNRMPPESWTWRAQMITHSLARQPCCPQLRALVLCVFHHFEVLVQQSQRILRPDKQKAAIIGALWRGMRDELMKKLIYSPWRCQEWQVGHLQQILFDNLNKQVNVERRAEMHAKQLRTKIGAIGMQRSRLIPTKAWLQRIVAQCSRYICMQVWWEFLYDTHYWGCLFIRSWHSAVLIVRQVLVLYSGDAWSGLRMRMLTTSWSCWLPCIPATTISLPGQALA